MGKENKEVQKLKCEEMVWLESIVLFWLLRFYQRWKEQGRYLRVRLGEEVGGLRKRSSRREAGRVPGPQSVMAWQPQGPP